MAVRHVPRHRGDAIAERDVGERRGQVFGALDDVRLEAAELGDRLDVPGEGEVVADRGAHKTLLGERARADRRVLARQRMVCRQREDDRRAGKRKHAEPRRVLRRLARKAGIELVRQDRADQLDG